MNQAGMCMWCMEHFGGMLEDLWRGFGEAAETLPGTEG